jgi:abequosyltransferase
LRPGALEKIMDGLKDHDPAVFMTTNGHLGIPKGKAECDSLDSFVSTVSFHGTWLCAIGFKRSLWNELKTPDAAIGTNIIHLDWVLRILDSHSKAYIDDSVLFDEPSVSSKGGYNIFEVFVQNYLSMLSARIAKGTLSERIYSAEKRRLFLEFILPWCLEMMIHHERYHFRIEGGIKILARHYGYIFLFANAAWWMIPKVVETSVRFFRMIDRYWYNRR